MSTVGFYKPVPQLIPSRFSESVAQGAAKAGNAPPPSGGWFSYDNYEDCMLGKMKGQNQSMYVTADKACKKEFGIQIDIYPGNVKWEFHTDFLNRQRIEIIDASNDTDKYEIKSGEFSFSEKPCEGLSPVDFSKPVKLNFANDSAGLPSDMSEMHCARALSFKGKYK